MSTTRFLLQDFDVYNETTTETLKQKIEVDTRELESWKNQGRRSGLIYFVKPSTSSSQDTAPAVEEKKGGCTLI